MRSVRNISGSLSGAQVFKKASIGRHLLYHIKQGDVDLNMGESLPNLVKLRLHHFPFQLIRENRWGLSNTSRRSRRILKEA